MRRGTTPTVVLTVTNDDGSDCNLTGHDLYITFQEKGVNGVTFTKREDDEGVSVEHVDKATQVSVTLSQDETLKFRQDSIVRVQLRCKAAGIAQATTIDQFNAEEILMDGEI